MGYSANTYIIIGVPVPNDWGYLPTDGSGDQDRSDDWHDRWGWLSIHSPKPGDLIYFNNLDGKNPYIGRVINFSADRWSDGLVFFDETIDVIRLQREIDEVRILLKEKVGIDADPALHIVTYLL